MDIKWEHSYKCVSHNNTCKVAVISLLYYWTHFACGEGYQQPVHYPQVLVCAHVSWTSLQSCYNRIHTCISEKHSVHATFSIHMHGLETNLTDVYYLQDCIYTSFFTMLVLLLWQLLETEDCQLQVFCTWYAMLLLLLMRMCKFKEVYRNTFIIILFTFKTR